MSDVVTRPLSSTPVDAIRVRGSVYLRREDVALYLLRAACVCESDSARRALAMVADGVANVRFGDEDWRVRTINQGDL